MPTNPARTPRIRSALLAALALALAAPGPAHAQQSSALSPAPAPGVTLTEVLVANLLLPDILVFTGDSSAPAARFSLGQDARGSLWIQQRLADGSIRSSALDLVVPPLAPTAAGLAPGQILVGPDQRAWLAVAADGRYLDLFALGKLGTGEAPVRLASVAVGSDFDPRSIQLGIIAILIGLEKQPAPTPTVSFRDGSLHRVLVWDGTSLLPFIEQQN